MCITILSARLYVLSYLLDYTYLAMEDVVHHENYLQWKGMPLINIKGI
jgi:hypothetical protein